MVERKERKRIPPELAADVLYFSDHTCCICGQPGPPNIHHIDENPANNNPENLAVLCLLHHNQAHVTGGFARQLSKDSIRKYRDEWLIRVKRRRDAADELVVSLAIVESQAVLIESKKGMNSAALKAFIAHLPNALRSLYESEQTNFDTGITGGMVQAISRISDALEKTWLLLVEDYPVAHFGENHHHQYISAYRAGRGDFHWALAIGPTSIPAAWFARWSGSRFCATLSG